jgi:hypothetical protein
LRDIWGSHSGGYEYNLFWDIYRRFKHPLDGRISTETSLKIHQTTRRQIPEEGMFCVLLQFELHFCKKQGSGRS